MKDVRHFMILNILLSIAPYAIGFSYLHEIIGVNVGIQMFVVTLALLYCGFFFLISLSTKLVMYVRMNENALQLLTFPFINKKHEWASITEIAFNLEGRNMQHIYIRIDNESRVDYSLNLNPYATNGEVTRSIKDNAHKHNIRVIDDLSANIH